jgi:hypothetical protein
MNTVIFAEGGSSSTWGIEAALPDRRRVGTIEQREDGFYVSSEGPAADLITSLPVHCAGGPGRTSRFQSGGSMEQQMAEGSPIRHTGEAPADAEQVYYAV